MIQKTLFPPEDHGSHRPETEPSTLAPEISSLMQGFNVRVMVHGRDEQARLGALRDLQKQFSLGEIIGELENLHGVDFQPEQILKTQEWVEDHWNDGTKDAA